jgi:hypothetical protein
VKFTRRDSIIEFSAESPSSSRQQQQPPQQQQQRSTSGGIRSRRRLSFGHDNDENNASGSSSSNNNIRSSSHGTTIKFGSDSSARDSRGWARNSSSGGLPPLPVPPAGAHRLPTPSYRDARRLVKRNTVAGPSSSCTNVIGSPQRALFGDSSNAITIAAAATTTTTTTSSSGSAGGGDDVPAAGVGQATAQPTESQQHAGTVAVEGAVLAAAAPESARSVSRQQQQKQQRKHHQHRRSSSAGGFMMPNVAKRKVIDASSPAKVAEAFFAPGHLTSDTFTELESRALVRVWPKWVGGLVA